MSSEKSNVPRFFVASKIKNMVLNMPNINPIKKTGAVTATTVATKDRDDEGMHSFHISEAQQKPFMDCDALFTDCEDFLKLASKTIEITNNKGKSGLSKLVHAVPMSDKISKWRSKRKENGLFEVFDSLQSRVESMDVLLNDISNTSSQSTSALMTQSVHLNVRLTSCIDYNKVEVDKAKPLVAEGRAFLNKLRATEKAYVTMMDFLEEINELKRNEPKAYVPWALRQQVEDEAEADRKAALARNELVELKRESIERRIKRIRKIIAPVQRLFDATEQKQHVRLDNLSHCLRSQLALLNFLHRCQSSVIIQSTTNGAASVSIVKAASGAQALPPTPKVVSPASPQVAAKSTGGFLNFANPIKSMTSPRVQSQPNAGKSPGGAAPYKPSIAELAAGIIPGGPNPNAGKPSGAGDRSSEGSGGRASTASGDANRPKGAGGVASSFDHDDENEADEVDEEEPVDDSTNPDNSIEKAVRHMRAALAGLQRNSGMVLEKVEPYDHCNCSDCAVVYDMANDCCMHIAAASFRGKQCAERLLRLNTYRDKMRESAEALDTEEWGGTHTASVDNK